MPIFPQYCAQLVVRRGLRFSGYWRHDQHSPDQLVAELVVIVRDRIELLGRQQHARGFGAENGWSDGIDR